MSRPVKPTAAPIIKLMTPPETPAPQTQPDTWLQRAQDRRKAEDSGEHPVTGARFNSFI